MPMGVNCGETDNASTLMTSAVGQPTRRRGFSCWDALVKTTTSTDKVSTYDNVQLVTLVSGWMVYFVWQTLLLLRYLWQATPLGVRSAKRRHQSPEWTILSHVDCFTQGEVVGFQVLLDSLQDEGVLVVSSSSPKGQTHLFRIQEVFILLHWESKKLCHFYFYCNFGKCWSIFKILSMSESERNGS